MLEYEKKISGAFFTSSDISHYLTERVIENKNQIVLEPSFGDGSFINAIIDHYIDMGWYDSLSQNIYAVEIREKAILQYITNPFLDSEKLFFGDFIGIEPFPVDIVIGNPPYIGLNKIPTSEQERAKKLLSAHNFNMQSNGSLWFPFIMHSCAFLNNGGTLAFILPFEITYVKYSRQLWKYLSQHFSELTIIRVYEDIFPDVDVETILFIAKGFGGSTNSVNYEIYDSRIHLVNGMILKNANISIESILNAERPFVSNLLDSDHLEIINKLRVNGYIKPINHFCKFKIGYVSADQQFFHPNDYVANYFGIADEDLVPSIVNAKSLKKDIGLEIKQHQVLSRLFYPKIAKVNHPYIKHGEIMGVNTRYKCRQRKTWYITPNIEIPDIILTVFGDKPRLYVNSGRYAASNSLLCGFLQQESLSPSQIALSWYNSLTLLSIELRVHSLGGGVLVFIPGEADSIEILDPRKIFNVDDKYFSDLEVLLRNSSFDDAYLVGDKYSLPSIGLSDNEIYLLQDAVKILRKWRNSRRRKKSLFNVME